MLLWQTHGGIANAAVLGIFPRLRYILLSDGLIEQLSSAQVEAVMAHEVAHVRRHHMPWLIVCGLAALSICVLAVNGLIWSIDQRFPFTEDAWDTAQTLGIVVALAPWALIFGYASRRFERHADTFAVQHLSLQNIDPHTPPNTISQQAVDAMAQSLQQVAQLNHVTPTRPSWRHGSIQWRVDYLHTLVGEPISPTRIDRDVRRICAAAVFVIGILTALAILTDRI